MGMLLTTFITMNHHYARKDGTRMPIRFHYQTIDHRKLISCVRVQILYKIYHWENLHIFTNALKILEASNDNNVQMCGVIT